MGEVLAAVHGFLPIGGLFPFTRGAHDNWQRDGCFRRGGQPGGLIEKKHQGSESAQEGTIFSLEDHVLDIKLFMTLFHFINHYFYIPKNISYIFIALLPAQYE